MCDYDGESSSYCTKIYNLKILPKILILEFENFEIKTNKIYDAFHDMVIVCIVNSEWIDTIW